MHYSVALVQCCLALGMQARMINLHHGISDTYRVGDEAIADPPVDEHVVAEVWCAELGKWVMMDTDYDCHYERDGLALSAWEIHQHVVNDELDLMTPRRGPHSQAFDAYGQRLPEVEKTFFSAELPRYYAHVSVLMRNDFLTDPDGPVTMAVLLDEDTAPILWHQGSDNRLQPHLMGPVVVAQPWVATTPALTDGNLATGWASLDGEGEHVVELTLAGPRLVSRVALHWPEYRMRYRSSSVYVLEGRFGDGDWQRLVEVEGGDEAPFSVYDFEPHTVSSIRLRQAFGGGSAEYPHRLWLNQIELYAPSL